MSASDDTYALRATSRAEAATPAESLRRSAATSACDASSASKGSAEGEDLDSWPHVDRRKTPDRRQRPTRWWDSLLGRKRRARGRREGEISNIYVDIYYSSDLILVVFVFILNLLDAFLTLSILDSGGREANPIMAVVLGAGATAFIVEKTLAVGLCLVTLVAHKTFPLARLSMHLLVGLYGLLTIYHILLRIT